MSYTESMTNALATTAVKFMGQVLPNMEFVMHPDRHHDLMLETLLHDGLLFEHDDGAWTFRGVPVRIEKSVTNWTLSAVTQ